ncbi:MAG: sodium/glutamate symporter [Candidatus Sulfopaludibacter sp.]|nr:sodium/glutamate symporter [Candidatus Sulfopaludibacter sp.]
MPLVSYMLWKLNSPQVLGLACLGIWLGGRLKRALPLLDRLNVPVPIAGGMVFALAALALRDRVLNVEADTTLRDLLMVAFMTTIGLSARLQLLRRGGGAVIKLLAISTFAAVLQNVLGMGMAAAMGLDARLGILAGSVALAGGPATAVAFGGTFEKLGVRGATAVAMASATFGIAIAGLIGGYIGGRLIVGRKLKGESHSARQAEQSTTAANLPGIVVIVGIAVGLGNLLSLAMERIGLILPAYIGAMIVAAVIRNLGDRFGWFDLAQSEIDLVGRVALYLFIVMALITLRLWELAHLALPLVAILSAQVAMCWAMCLTIVYWGMGRNYESAVTSAGFCGYMLGITANAVACMEELVEKFGPAPQSFLVVPVVGAFLIDFTNSMIITALANLTR